eukprot:3936854-Rhodomonas_salina.1
MALAYRDSCYYSASDSRVVLVPELVVLVLPAILRLPEKDSEPRLRGWLRGWLARRQAVEWYPFSGTSSSTTVQSRITGSRPGEGIPNLKR